VRPSKLGIIGLGAIGGSLALQAKRAGIATVLGWSPEPAERVAAARQGALDDAPARAADVAARGRAARAGGATGRQPRAARPPQATRRRGRADHRCRVR